MIYFDIITGMSSRIETFSRKVDNWLNEQGKHEGEKLATERAKAREFFEESRIPEMVEALRKLHPEVRDLGEIYPRAEKTRLTDQADIFRIKKGSVLHVLLVGEPRKTSVSFAPFLLGLANPAASGLDIRRPKWESQMVGIETRSNGDMVFHEGFIGKNKLPYKTWKSKEGALRAALSIAYDHPRNVTAFSPHYFIPR